MPLLRICSKAKIVICIYTITVFAVFVLLNRKIKNLECQ